MNTKQINLFINSSYPVSIILFLVLFLSGLIFVNPDDTVPKDSIELINTLGWIFIIGSLIMAITTILGFYLTKKNRTNW